MLKLFYKIFLLFIILLSATLLYQQNTYAYHTLVRIDPIPHTTALIAKEKYADAYEYLNYFMAFEYVKNNPKSQKLLSHIEEKRDSLRYQSEKVLEGLSTGTSDELLGQASAIGSDFFVLGDIRDLAIEATHYVRDEEVDSLLVALSGIGLVATAGTLFSRGSTAVVKTGVSVLKLAQKSKRIPFWLHAFLIKESKHISKTKNIASLTPLFTTLHLMHKQTSLAQTLKLLSHSRSFKELKKLSKLSKHYGKETATLLRLSNKQILNQSKVFNSMHPQSIKKASSFGESGFAHLFKRGEANFLKTTLRLKSYAKVGYKGEAWKVALTMMKSVDEKIWLLIITVCSLLLLPWRFIAKWI